MLFDCLNLWGSGESVKLDQNRAVSFDNHQSQHPQSQLAKWIKDKWLLAWPEDVAVTHTGTKNTNVTLQAATHTLVSLTFSAAHACMLLTKCFTLIFHVRNTFPQLLFHLFLFTWGTAEEMLWWFLLPVLQLQQECGRTSGTAHDMLQVAIHSLGLERGCALEKLFSSRWDEPPSITL